ncbi:hypothetical protein [Citrobacter phage Tr1]|nr:hypothetical protein [Citrobacter phage Tr1]
MKKYIIASILAVVATGAHAGESKISMLNAGLDMKESIQRVLVLTGGKGDFLEVQKAFEGLDHIIDRETVNAINSAASCEQVGNKVAQFTTEYFSPFVKSETAGKALRDLTASQITYVNEKCSYLKG